MQNITQIFEEAGRSTKGFKNSKFVKAIDWLIRYEKFVVSIAPIGEVFTTNDGFEFNVEFFGYGQKIRLFLGNDFSAKEVSAMLCKWIQISEIHEQRMGRK
jgi:hypothetical protein